MRHCCFVVCGGCFVVLLAQEFQKKVEVTTSQTVSADSLNQTAMYCKMLVCSSPWNNLQLRGETQDSDTRFLYEKFQFAIQGSINAH